MSPKAYMYFAVVTFIPALISMVIFGNRWSEAVKATGYASSGITDMSIMLWSAFGWIILAFILLPFVKFEGKKEDGK